MPELQASCYAVYTITKIKVSVMMIGQEMESIIP
jgi:hypothetical protein